MISMYNRFLCTYELAVLGKSKINLDDAWLDSVCFNTQQALEFLMKHILNLKNIPYKKTHDILELLGLLDDVGFTFKKHDELELLGSTITDWEEGSRYGSGVRTSVQTINRVFKIIDSINESFLNEQDSVQNLELFE